MKCAAIKLSSRQEQSRKMRQQTASPTFTGEEGHSYSFPFSRPKAAKSSNLAITNINLPDNTPSFNTGSSLDRWAQKRVRLKSAKISKTPTEFDKDFCYETLEGDLSILLNPEDPESPGGSLDNLHYEVHSDIEKLLEETQRSVHENEGQNRRRKKRGKEHKKKKSKTIKFSKPSSPQTEQVIRVDLTSNVSNEEKRKIVEVPKLEEVKPEIDENRKELKRNFNESVTEMCDEDFIVKCRQLALRQRRRL